MTTLIPTGRRRSPGMPTAAAIALASIATLNTRAAPTVFWASDPVEPNDTVLVAGSGFGTSPTVELLGMPDGPPLPAPIREAPWSPAAKPRVISPLQPTDESLKFIVPADLAPGAWQFRVRNADGTPSPPARLNTPTVYWMQGDTGLDASAPGGWLRVFGRNVGAPGHATLVRLQRRDRTIQLSPTRSGRWSATADLPADLAPGDWAVAVHNGLGGPYGWAEAGVLHVAANEPWPTRVFNVRDYGATGQATDEDSVAIDRALAAAQTAGGGIVFFPRGRYLMNHSLALPRLTVLRGEGRDLASVMWPNTDTPYVLIQGQDHFAIEDLTLYASSYTHAIAGSINTPESGHAFVRRVCLRADIYRGHLKPEEVDQRFRATLKLSTGGGDSIRLGGERVEVTDCDIYGSGRAIYLQKPRGGLVTRNRFYNGRWGWYCLTGADGLIFEDNTLTGADLMSTGGGINCLGAKFSRNVYYAGNTIALCHGWDREAMTSDAGGGAYYGKPAATDGKTLVLPEPGTWRGDREQWTGAGVFVLGGHGMGQYREIAAVADDDKTITLDRPWAVPPDTTSILSVTAMQRNYMFVSNHFADAGIAIQYYGTSIDNIADANTCTRAGGFYNSGRWYHHYQPSWYCQFFRNEILAGNCYRFGPNNASAAGDSYIGTFGIQYGDNPTPLAYCSVHRHNNLHNNAMIRLIGTSRKHPGLRDAVVEHNRVANVDVGLFVDDGCVGIVERENTFVNVGRDRINSEEIRREHARKRAALNNRAEPVYQQDFEHKFGKSFIDTTTNGFMAVETAGTVPLEDGIDGKCGRFDGKAYLTVKDGGALRFPKMTISAWVRPDEPRGRWGVVARRDTGSTSPYVLAIRDNRVTFEATAEDGKWSYNLLSQPALTATNWNHIAATCDDGHRVAVYCNGKLVAEKPVDTPITLQDDQALTIGFEAWGGNPADAKTSGNLRGCIDDVRIWSRLLTPDEIHREYERLAPAAPRP